MRGAHPTGARASCGLPPLPQVNDRGTAPPEIGGALVAHPEAPEWICLPARPSLQVVATRTDRSRTALVAAERDAIQVGGLELSGASDNPTAATPEPTRTAAIVIPCGA